MIGTSSSRRKFERSRHHPHLPVGHPKRRLSDEDVAEIRKLSLEGFSSGDLAMVFPVSSSAIRNILGGRRRA